MGEIDEDYIDNICEDLRCYMVNVLDNPGDNDLEYETASKHINHISSALDLIRGELTA